MTESRRYRDAIANWSFFSDTYKDKYGVRPDYSYYKEKAEEEERRSDPNYTEVWTDFYGNPVRVRFVNGEAVAVD